MVQREDIAALLQQQAAVFDPTLDTTKSSPFYRQVITPILDALGPDPLTTAPLEFIKDRVRKEYPSLGLDDDEPLMDIVAKPLALAMGALNDQILRVKQKQSLARPDLLTEPDADDLMGNWFVTREQGVRPAAFVRVFYSSPTPVSVNPSHRFFTSGGLNFFPPNSQSISSAQMATQMSGEEYFVEFLVRAEFPGEDYAVAVGAIANVDGLPNHTRVSNLAKASVGRNREDNEEFLLRARQSLVERSMTSPRGIAASIRELGTITRVEVAKYNDTEMQRDILTGAGEGRVHLSGMGVVFGTSLLIWSGYEDRGEAEEVFVEAGYEVTLHYGKILYGLPASQRHEDFLVDSVIYDSRGSFPELPNILLIRLDHDPTPTSTVSGVIPGFLPGVSAAIKRPGKIRISNIPGGIQAPVGPTGEVEIFDGEVHIGGHHDVWLRPAAPSEATVTMTVADEDPLVVGLTLQTFGTTTPNVVSSSDITLDWVELGVQPGMYLSIDEGADVGVYRILAVRPTQLVLDAALTALDVGIRFQVVDGLKLDLVQPRAPRIPFGADAPGNDLETIIGSTVVVLGVNSLSFGVGVGDTLRILEGDDEGDYLIQGFDSSGGGTTPIVDRVMSNSSSGLTYQIFRAGAGVQLPLVRIPASGVVLLDSSDQPTDISVPYALPVEARARQAFTGAGTKACGDLGFTVPGLGLAFENAGEACPSTLEQAIVLLQGMSGEEGALADLDPYPEVSAALFESELGALVVTDGAGAPLPGGVYDDVVAGMGDGWAGSNDQSLTDAVAFAFGSPPSAHPAYSPGVRHVASYARGFTVGHTSSIHVRMFYLAGTTCEMQGILTGYGKGRNDIVTALATSGPYEVFSSLPSTPATLTPVRGSCLPADFDPAWEWGYLLGYYWTLWSGAGLSYAGVFPMFEEEDTGPGSEATSDERLLLRLLSAPNKYSDECLECDGYIFCVTLDSTGIFLNYDLPEAGRTYVNAITDWLTKTISAFFPSFVAGTPSLLEVDGGLQVAWNRGSLDEGEEDADGTAAMQFEICIPRELVGCCSNLFVAFPDVDLDLILRKLSDWVQAMDSDPGSDASIAILREVINLLPNSEPPLCTSIDGDTLLLTEGPNAGGYVVDSTYELSLDVTPLASGIGLLFAAGEVAGGGDFFWFMSGLSIASALMATGSNAEANQLLDDLYSELGPSGGGDPAVALQLLQEYQVGLDVFRPVLKMCAVGIRGQFPVDPWKPYCEMFASGFPVVPPLPGIPPFEAEICDNYGDAADPFDLLVDLITWVFESLRLLGFDLPQNFDVTFSEILAGLLDGMKVPYCVGSRTCTGQIRLYFHEPTTMEVDAGRQCVAFYDPTNVDPAQFPYDSTGCTAFWDGHALEDDFVAGLLAGYADGLLDPVTITGSDALGYGSTDLAAGFPGTYEDDVLAVAGPSYRPVGYNLSTYNGAYGIGYFIGWGLDMGSSTAGVATTDTVDGYTAGLADGIVASGAATIELLAAGAWVNALDAGYAPPAGPASAVADYRAGYAIGRVTGTLSCLLASDIGSFGSGAIPVVLDARVPTLLSSTVGAMEVLFGGDDEAAPYQVLPPQETVAATSPVDYPRDVSVGAPLSVDGKVFTPLQLTDPTRDAPISLGIQSYYDEVEIHEETLLLRSSVVGVRDTVRAAVVATRNGSNIVTVLTEGVDFRGQGAAALAGLGPVRVGDLLFVDEGADEGGYTVTRVVSGTQVQLDRPMTDTSLPADKSGATASYDVSVTPDRVTVGAGTFNSADVGKWLSLFSSHYPENTGSYKILATDGTYVDLDNAALTGAEVTVDWAVTAAPALTPAALSGGTELVVGRRIRVYEKTAASFNVVGVSDDLDPATASFYAWAASQPMAAVFRGTDQPFRVVRPGIQRISSTQMEANREGSLYYFDVYARALGTDEVHNVPAEQRFEAVFGTYRSDGYHYEVVDTNFTFSPEEQVALRLSPSFLPVGRDDTLGDQVPLNGQTLQISYDNAPAVADVHRMLIDPGSRTVNANPIARHFLPSYVSVEVQYYGGESETLVGARIQEKIQDLEAVDSMAVAGVVETALREAKATDWVHDIYLVTVTHDIDRRLVGNRSRDRLGGDEPQYFNGSNRLSYFIPGENTGSVDDVDLVPGDMVRAVRFTLPIALR